MNEVRNILKKFNHYVDNYEEEIIKERVDNQKTMMKLKKEIDVLKQELKNSRRSYNREEITYDEYLEDKKDITMELEDLESRLKEFENDVESDTLIKYKKAIPKLEMCLKEYDKMTIPEKNESLKSIIERITYYKTKRLNWRKKEEDDMIITIDMKL